MFWYIAASIYIPEPLWDGLPRANLCCGVLVPVLIGFATRSHVEGTGKLTGAVLWLSDNNNNNNNICIGGTFFNNNNNNKNNGGNKNNNNNNNGRKLLEDISNTKGEVLHLVSIEHLFLLHFSPSTVKRWCSDMRRPCATYLVKQLCCLGALNKELCPSQLLIWPFYCAITGRQLTWWWNNVWYEDNDNRDSSNNSARTPVDFQPCT